MRDAFVLRLVAVEEVYEFGLVEQLGVFGVDWLAFYGDLVSVFDVYGEVYLAEGTRAQLFLHLVCFSDCYL